MDDLEFRRRAYAEPNNDDTDFVSKKNESPENRRFVEELQAFDQRLHDTLHVEPPEGLAERIKLNQALGAHRYNRARYRMLLSLAASIVLVIGMTLGFVQFMPRDDLSGKLLTHVYDELHHLQDDFDYSLDNTNQVLAAQGIQLSKAVGRVRYVGKCEIDRQEGVHMVLQGRHGPVTVMMMPGRNIDEPMTVLDQRFHGSIEPLSSGSVAIIAEKNESIDELRQNLKDSLQWQF